MSLQPPAYSVDGTSFDRYGSTTSLPAYAPVAPQQGVGGSSQAPVQESSLPDGQAQPTSNWLGRKKEDWKRKQADKEADKARNSEALALRANAIKVSTVASALIGATAGSLYSLN